MPEISITSSLYRAEKFLPTWIKNIENFALEAGGTDLSFEINAILNDPTSIELDLLKPLTSKSWFRLHSVPREPIYATWNRGVELANAPVCTSWNVDDQRNAAAMVDGLRLIKAGAAVVYFPFIYKRYFHLLGLDILVKKVIIDPPPFNREHFTREMHCGPFFMFTKECFAQVGSFDPTFRIAGDYDWCVRAAKMTTFEKSTVIAGTFEKRPGTLSGGRSPLQVAENQRIIARHGK